MNKIMKKVITGTLIGAMTLSMAGMAFADSSIQSIQKEKAAHGMRFTKEQRYEKFKEMKELSPEERKAKMEEKLAEAVKNGKMTQEKADELLEKMANNEGKFHKGMKPNKEDLKKLSPEERKAKMEERLAEAVKNGKMTQEKADELLEKMANNEGEFHKGMKPNKEELKKLSPEERKAKMEERLAEAVTNGKMTQEKADELLAKWEK